jgi:two-component system, response regulator YesN
LKNFSWKLLRDINYKIIKNLQSKNIQVIEKTKEYVEKNYSQEIRLEDISRYLNISPFHLSRMFKRETGNNIFDYLSMVRIDKSKELLIGSEISVKEICYNVGYSDPNYYCKVFKKVVGLTPTTYRDLNREK